ncbi:hypothetical protein AB0442_36205 [Kitasatospora sp. NPDC085895]|uniref:hypothetical protein n=1 Tax=Kitasatospora sp. NPDC085895 TaxID=3155057 RepID=UPI00344D8034
MNTADTATLALQSGPYLGAATAAGGGAWLWAFRCRLRRARAALGNRAAVELVPTATFDPSEGEVRRFGHHLARVRHAAASVPNRGAAVRLRYRSVQGGLMRCYLEGPEHAASVLGMPGFAEVEVRAARSENHIEPVRFTLPAQRGVQQ